MNHCSPRIAARNLLLLCLFSTGWLHSAEAQQPNIIFILADDLGYGEIGTYGQEKIETPNIDRLAASGLKYTQFYSGSTVCGPARCSFMTGLHTGHTVIRGNKPFAPEGQIPLPDSVRTIANLLQENGYATAAFGKWGLGFNQNSGDPNKKGFDRFYGYNCQSLAHDYFPLYLWDNHQKVDLAVNQQADSVYSASLIHQKAIEYIKQSGDQPFFLYLPYTLPHGDVIGPHDDLYNYYVSKFNETPLSGSQLKKREHTIKAEPLPHAQFAAMVGRLDRYVGEIVKTLEEKGLAQNTLIIFTSDNGPHRENGGDPDFFNSNGIYKGIKRDLYEGGIRVPFIAYWPGKINPAVTDQMAALWDLYPSFLELAGIKNSNQTDGLSLLPGWLQKGKQLQHDYLYWEFHENDGRQAIRWKQWKGVKLAVMKNENAPLELYDLKKDPEEKTNLASQKPRIVRKLAALIEQAHTSNPDWPLLKKEMK
ncbi:MAG TPA: arylsulfatase [Chitinophagaceae bacterium]|nr:arylsulfatase [Chitinophagaceae bacterium]